MRNDRYIATEIDGQKVYVTAEQLIDHMCERMGVQTDEQRIQVLKQLRKSITFGIVHHYLVRLIPWFGKRIVKLPAIKAPKISKPT